MRRLTLTDDFNRPHDGFLQMAKPYIAAFKKGSRTVNTEIQSDLLVYWYRPTLKSASCDSTDTCEKPWPSATPNHNYFVGKPNGYDTMQDVVFVVALLKSAGTVTVQSGSNTKSFNAPAGATSFQVPMGVGAQSFSLTRGGQTVLSGTSLKNIISDCVCGIYNFNAYVGTLPTGPSDPLQPDGLKSFATSLQATCQPTPSLGAAPAGKPVAAPIINNPATDLPAHVAAPSISPSISPPPSHPVPQDNAIIIPLASSTPPATSASVTPAPAAGGGGGGSKTITALSQLFPTNCMHAGYVWGGPPGSNSPAHCDGG